MPRRPPAPPALEHVPWETFLPRMQWRQGEHVSLIGPTGYGKTTVALDLLRERTYQTICATKPRDAVLQALVRSGEYQRIKSWPPPGPPTVRTATGYVPTKWSHLVLWPEWKGSADTAKMGETFWEALAGIFAEGKWCVYVDELAYMVRRLGLATDLQDFWQQGRSLGLSLVGATQRPAWVPLDLYSQADHLVLYTCTDETDLRRVQGLAGIDPATIRRLLRSLRKYEFVYVNKATEQVVVSKSPPPS